MVKVIHIDFQGCAETSNLIQLTRCEIQGELFAGGPDPERDTVDPWVRRQATDSTGDFADSLQDPREPLLGARCAVVLLNAPDAETPAPASASDRVTSPSGAVSCEPDLGLQVLRIQDLAQDS